MTPEDLEEWYHYQFYDEMSERNAQFLAWQPIGGRTKQSSKGHKKLQKS
jgi:hypothetical protein